MNQTETETMIQEFYPEGFVYIDLKNDFSFKKVFGTKGNEDLLLLLISSILPDKHIASVQLSSQEHMGNRQRSRKSVNDIHCTTRDGQEFIVEMQLGDQDFFGDRMLFYASYSITDQIRIGDTSKDKYRLKPVYVIGITDFIISEIGSDDNVVHSYALLDTENKSCEFTGSLNFVTVELPKFRKSYDELETDLDKLLYLFQNLPSIKAVPEKIQGQSFDKLFKVCKFASMDEMSQREYLSHLMALRDERARMATATDRGLELGRTVGRAQGLEEGRAQGLEEGRAEGRAEQTLSIARAMKAEGVQLDTIQRCTGLSEAEIQAL